MSKGPLHEEMTAAVAEPRLLCKPPPQTASSSPALAAVTPPPNPWLPAKALVGNQHAGTENGRAEGQSREGRRRPARQRTRGAKLEQLLWHRLLCLAQHVDELAGAGLVVGTHEEGVGMACMCVCVVVMVGVCPEPLCRYVCSVVMVVAVVVVVFVFGGWVAGRALEPKRAVQVSCHGQFSGGQVYAQLPGPQLFWLSLAARLLAPAQAGCSPFLPARPVRPMRCT